MITVYPKSEPLTVYSPRAKGEAWLNRAMEYIQSVNYKVSARWVSYRLLQDGTIKNKDEFSKLDNYMSRARKANWNGWDPFTLSDSIREPINVRPPAKGSAKSYANSKFRKVEEPITAYVPRWFYEEYYVEVWYEARAMTGQFQSYVSREVTLQPSGGDMSIPIKAEGAKRISQWCRVVGKPAVILYFGDLDEKGGKIPEAIARDVYEWCPEVTMYLCGLTREQQEAYNLPEQPDKPGNYQWEALDDTQAAEIIHGALSEFLTDEAQELADQEEQEIAAEAETLFRALLEDWI